MKVWVFSAALQGCELTTYPGTSQDFYYTACYWQVAQTHLVNMFVSSTAVTMRLNLITKKC